MPSGFPKEFKHIHLDNLSTPKNEPAGQIVVKNGPIEASFVAGPNVVAAAVPTLPVLFRLDGGGAEGDQKQCAGYWLA